MWEAGIKQTKHHLNRVAGHANLTFEEMYTLLAQIEAILNSRPLSPMSNDPNDLSVLTPGHFLIGDSLRAIPEPSLGHILPTRLSRWQHIQQMQQHFWTRWQKEYLLELQTRGRWRQDSTEPVEVGQLVLVREDNLPACQWKIGRIQEIHPGKDGLIRVATIRTAHDILKRPIVKLCLFPTVSE